jgi:protein-tyrosine phosphatase
MIRILFVCTANRCRSPMAALLFCNLLDPAESTAWHIDSAGTWAAEELPAMQNAISIMAEMGLNLASHRSRAVCENLLAEQNLILVMESSHREALAAEFPQAASRIRLLSEMAGPSFDIEDPVANPMNAYRATARLLHKLLCDGMPQIRALAAQPLEA